MSHDLVISKTLELSAPPERVWRALTDDRELAAWFGQSATFPTEIGGDGWFGWDEHGQFAVRVVELDPPRRLAWRWAHEASVSIDDTHTTLVEWTLTPTPNGGTVLELRESGFATARHHGENTDGWKEELDHLTAHLG